MQVCQAGTRINCRYRRRHLHLIILIAPLAAREQRRIEVRRVVLREKHARSSVATVVAGSSELGKGEVRKGAREGGGSPRWPADTEGALTLFRTLRSPMVN